MNRIIQNYKSRETLLELLKKRDFKVEEYEGFSVNEIDTMTRNNTLDMFMTTDPLDTDKIFKKAYVKYLETFSPILLENIINDLFENAEEKYKLRPDLDTLAIIIHDEPNDKTRNSLITMYETRGLFVTVINIHRLQFNVLNHELQPREISILTDTEKTEFMKNFNIRNYLTDIPEISRFDPLALALFLKPGDVCRFLRDSPVAISAVYYRVCV